MKPRISIIIFLFLLALLAIQPASAEEAPDSLWWRVYGDYGKSLGFDVEPLPDGCVVVSGTHGSETEVPPNADPWLLKFDPDGNLLWESRLGGPQWDMGNGMALTPDGGYILCGSTSSYGAGLTDIYVVKTDSLGQEEWHTTVGSTDRDFGRDLEVTPEGDYVVTGWTERLGYSNQEIVIAKLSGVDGSIIWAREYGGDDKEEAWTIEVLQDGNYAVAGRTWSFNDTNNRDLIILKVTPDGDLLWFVTYGGPEKDHIYEFQETPDGGFICTGKTESFDLGQGDAWLLKYDSEGEQEWVSIWGTIYLEFGRSVDLTTDGGYVMSGVTQEQGQGNQVLIAKADHEGNWVWEQIYGGSQMDDSWGVRQTYDLGYVATGLTWSEGLGERNLWVTKFDASYDPILVNTTSDVEIIEVPAEIDWTSTIHNFGRFSYGNKDLWTRWLLPGGIITDPVVQVQDGITILPVDSLTYQGSSMIGADVETGEHVLSVHVGDYPDSDAYGRYTFFFINTDVAEAPDQPQTMGGFGLKKPHPNPFNMTASVEVELPASGTLTLELYDVNGRLVRTLAQSTLPAGQHRFTLSENNLASGVYFVRASVPGKLNAVRKIVLVR